MMKFYCKILGEDYNYVKQFHPSSKRKIALLANCLLVPVILWFINGYLLVNNVLDGNFQTSILTAIIVAFVIFLIERAVIMSNGSKVIVVFRIALGIVVALLGSISLDEVIFKNDIEHKMNEYKENAVQIAERKVLNDYISRMNNQQSIVNQKVAIWDQSLKDAKSEADGTGGSKSRNVGKITRLKIQVAGLQEKDYIKENTKLNALENTYETEKIKAKTLVEAGFNKNALLLRIRALFELAKTDIFMLLAYLLFTAFLFFLEFLVVIIKMCSKNSIDEDLEIAREQLIRLKTQKALSHRMVAYNPGDFQPAARLANKYLSQNNTSVFN